MNNLQSDARRASLSSWATLMSASYVRPTLLHSGHVHGRRLVLSRMVSCSLAEPH